VKYDVLNKRKEVYVRDAQGNVVAVYEVKMGMLADSLFTKEFNIYGSKRIGYLEERNFLGRKCKSPLCFTATGSTGAVENILGGGGIKSIKSIPFQPSFGGSGVLPGKPWVASIYYGRKRYELADWLGNVRVVVSDKKVPDSVSGGAVLKYKPEVLSVRDYYAYGSEINERTYEPIIPKYRYGFNTQEKVFEISKDHYTARYWEYDSRLGRRWNVDIVQKYYESTYYNLRYIWEGSLSRCWMFKEIEIPRIYG